MLNAHGTSYSMLNDMVGVLVEIILQREVELDHLPTLVRVPQRVGRPVHEETVERRVGVVAVAVLLPAWWRNKRRKSRQKHCLKSVR